MVLLTVLNNLCGRPPQYAPPLQVDLWPFDIESGVRVMSDMGYLCANFSLPRPLSLLDLGLMYATDRRQTDRQTSDTHNRLMSPPYEESVQPTKAAWWPWPLNWPFDLESGVRVTWATSVPILVFLGLSVLDLGPMYATDKTSDRQTSDSIIA